MAKEILEDRRKAFEDAFFRRENERLRSELAEKREREATITALRDASGISDDDLLARIADLGIGADTVAALSLVPLVEVAWADGKMDNREREAILRAAKEAGVDANSASFELLDAWMTERPAASMMSTWGEYIRGVCGELSAEQRWRLEESLVGRAQSVAAAAGGFLGLGRVSPEEEGVLESLRQVFKS